jgi:pimeloyl-ACP methyl ester carboxylesterase
MTRRKFLGSAAALGVAACGRAGAGPELRHPPIGDFVSVDGLRVHYVDTGADTGAAGPPVVLIHGASGNLRDFTFSLTDQLAKEGLRAIAFDRPGLGYTDRPTERGWDPAVQARILRRAAAALGVDRAVVAGHSWGGAAAMAWALDAPESVAGVLSLAGATYPWGGDAGLLYSLGASPIFSGATRRVAALLVDEENPDDVLARIFKPNAPHEGYADYIGVGLALRAGSFRANAEDLDNLHGALERMAPRYPSLPMPVEAIHGKADKTVWAEVHSEPLARDVPQGRLTLLEGVGHMPHHVDETATVAAIRRLVAMA